MAEVCWSLLCLPDIEIGFTDFAEILTETQKTILPTLKEMKFQQL